jgi:uncharacterized protein YukE
MSDVLSDPRAARLLSTDPGELSALAGMFGTVASKAQSTSGALRGAHGDATWTGLAADAFRHQLGKLPGDLDKVHRSYQQVTDALHAYEGELGPIQSQFRQLASQLEGLQGSLTSAQGTLTSAQGSLSSAVTAPGAKSNSPAVVNAHTAVQQANAAVGRLQGEISGLNGRGHRLLDEFDHARGRATSAVSSAAGIAPSQSWWSSFWHSVGNFMSGAGHVLAGIAMGVVHSAESLPSDIVNVVENPTDLHDWAKLGEDVGAVAGAVGLVALVLICPADALGLDAAVGVFEAADTTATGVGLGASAVKADADVNLALQGKGSWGTVAFDAAGFAASDVHVPGLGDAEAAQKALMVKSGALEQYGLSRALGATHQQAYAELSDAQRLVLTKSAAKLSNPGRLTYMRSTTTEALETTETKLHRLDALNEVVHFGYDKGSGAVQKKLIPSDS